MKSGVSIFCSGRPGLRPGLDSEWRLASWHLRGWREDGCLGPPRPHQFVLPFRVAPPQTPALETPAATMTRLQEGAVTAALQVSGMLGLQRRGAWGVGKMGVNTSLCF